MRRISLLLFLGVVSMVAAANVLLVGTAEPELAFIRATAMKPFHARHDIPFDEAKAHPGGDLTRYKVVVLAKGAAVADPPR